MASIHLKEKNNSKKVLCSPYQDCNLYTKDNCFKFHKINLNILHVLKKYNIHNHQPMVHILNIIRKIKCNILSFNVFHHYNFLKKVLYKIFL